ncbi:MAG: LicD family protein [Candidatus Margulisbacteria bacterium]|nr:LicD family protein [Candidatus Margulisiibacteriota bacterium]
MTILSLFSSFYPKIRRLKRFKIEGLENKPEAPQVLREGCQALEKMNIPYWLASGTLLGIHRNKAFIPHDTDIDVEVFTPKSFDEIVNGIPFEPIQVMERRGKLMQIAFMGPNNIIFDIYFYHEYGPNLLNFNEWGIFHYPKSMIDRLTTLEFQGTTYPVPDPDPYCAFRYGSDWQTPKTYKGIWANDAPNLVRYHHFRKIRALCS